jgi:hypothetical protein
VSERYHVIAAGCDRAGDTAATRPGGQQFCPYRVTGEYSCQSRCRAKSGPAPVGGAFAFLNFLLPHGGSLRAGAAA